MCAFCKVKILKDMLYTGKGDGGTTTGFGCDQHRISKSSELPEALGALDEANAFIGFVKIRAAKESSVVRALHEAQECLFIAQAEIAGADKHIKAGAVADIEHTINEIEVELPPITGFSISGGTELSALLDVARTLARRAERRVVAVGETGTSVSPETRAYLNRLSSLLFALARLANHRASVADEHPCY